MPADIPFLDLTRVSASQRSDLDRAIAGCLDRGVYLRGPETSAFEEEWAEFCGQRHAVACNSGTDALSLAAAALRLRSATVTAVTLPLTAVGLHRGGATVSLADVDNEGWPLTAVADEVPVLLHGRLPKASMAPAALYDAAHAHGWRPPRASAAAWSFYPTKTLGALGDAGAITTDDDGLADTMRDLAGRDDVLRDRRQITSRIDEVQAAVLRVRLRLLPAWLDERAAIARRYDSALAPHGVTLPGESLHHLYVIRVPDRDGLQRSLSDAGIGSKAHWPASLDALDGPWIRSPTLPGARRWAAEVLSLPCYPGLTEPEVDRVSTRVIEHLSGRAG